MSLRAVTRRFDGDLDLLAAAGVDGVVFERERARLFIRRVHASPDTVNAQTLWLATRIEYKLGNTQGAQDSGMQLSNRFPESAEARAFNGGRFDD